MQSLRFVVAANGFCKDTLNRANSAKHNTTIVTWGAGEHGVEHQNPAKRMDTAGCC